MTIDFLKGLVGGNSTATNGMMSEYVYKTICLTDFGEFSTTEQRLLSFREINQIKKID